MSACPLGVLFSNGKAEKRVWIVLRVVLVGLAVGWVG